MVTLPGNISPAGPMENQLLLKTYCKERRDEYFFPKEWERTDRLYLEGAVQHGDGDFLGAVDTAVTIWDFFPVLYTSP